MQGVSPLRVVAGFQVLKDQYVQWGQQVEQVAPKEAPNTQGPEPLGTWAIPTPPRQDCSSANEHAPVTRPPRP